jgi:[acyl-carrier-protein] S-malonyltransferase
MNNDWKHRIHMTAFAFRGYNVTNLGRSRELLEHAAYGASVARHLNEASELCSASTGRKVDLVARVEQGDEPDLDAYEEAVGLIVAMEMAQISLLEEFHGVVYANARLVYGYSLGELAALACGEEFEMAQALEIPLAMARDCAALAHQVTLGVLFSRGQAIDYDNVQRLCLRVNAEGNGVIGISAILSPNTILLMGQHDTLARFKATMRTLLPDYVHLRPNSNNWPPLHTPIMWERSVPNRSAYLMHTMPGCFTVPHPPVLSLVTGKTSYNDFNTRETLHRWVDHPQRLWDAICGTLATGVETVVHVGPEPNLIPATFKRLSDNITEQTSGSSIGSFSLRAMSGLANRQWLANILPSRTTLLRAPRVQHVILENWLLEQPVG